jgi:sulfate adenylyltransferase subunit 2
LSTSTRKAWRQDINPFDHGSAKHTDVMKTEGLKQALDKYGSTPRSAAPAATRRNPAPRSGSTRSATSNHRWDPKNQRPELWNLYNGKVNKGESHPRVSAVQLDRAGYLAIHLSGKHSDRAAVFAAERPVVEMNGVLIMVDDDRMPLRPWQKAA